MSQDQTTLPAVTSGADWIYLKLYLGKAVDRIDGLLLQIFKALQQRDDVAAWFYIRYVDESGIHLRLRARPKDPDQKDTLHRGLVDTAAGMLNRIFSLTPGTYFPMVATPGFEDQLEQVTDAHNDVRVVEADYEPETDKFGQGEQMAIAEALFADSSAIACRILEDEDAGHYSRKSLIPAMMADAFAQFMPKDKEEMFWREYCYYWLGGKTPAGDDWRETFFSKAEQLAEEGVSILNLEQDGDTPAAKRMAEWREALASAAARYETLGQAPDPEILTFYIAHLMNNRLGVAVLEEAYLASLLEKAAREGAAQSEAV